MGNILVTGGSGVLGRYVRNRFSQGNVVLAPTRQEFPLQDPAQMRAYLDTHAPDTVLHLAAMTNVDQCEQQPEEAMRINGHATAELARWAKEHGAFLAYVSTAAVFPGTKEYCVESDPTSPVNAYGKSKLAGEQAIQELLENYLILRSAWMIGGGKAEKKFVSYIVGQAKDRPVIEAVHDKVGTITYAEEFADVLARAIAEGRTGIYHYGSKGPASRFELAQEIVKTMGSSTKVVPVASSRFETQFSAPRPDREVLASTKWEFPNTWQESLRTYLEREILSSDNE